MCIVDNAIKCDAVNWGTWEETFLQIQRGQRPGKGISSFPSFRCPLEEDLPSFSFFSTTFPDRSGASSYVVTTRVVSNSASHPTTEQPAVRYRQQNDNIVTTR